MNQFTFMRQIDKSVQERMQARIERERVANNFRRWVRNPYLTHRGIYCNSSRLGNSAYRKAQFSTAIELYNHGLDYVNDTPVLYLNRACCYIRYACLRYKILFGVLIIPFFRLRDFKRAIIDCDYILHKFDPKHIRAWLYRALSFKRLHVENSFNECISEVKRLNSRDIAFIDGFLERMRSAP